MLFARFNVKIIYIYRTVNNIVGTYYVIAYFVLITLNYLRRGGWALAFKVLTQFKVFNFPFTFYVTKKTAYQSKFDKNLVN